MLFAVKLTGIGPARLWVTGFGCIQGEWLLKQGVYGDTLTLQGKTVLSTGNIFAVYMTIFGIKNHNRLKDSCISSL